MGSRAAPFQPLCLVPSEAVPGWPYLELGWEGPQGQWEGQPGQWGWPEISGKGHSLREPALGLGSVPPPSLGARGNRAGVAGGPEVHNVLLKKVRLQLAGSIQLGLVGVPAHSSLSQIFLQAGLARPLPGRPSPPL